MGTESQRAVVGVLALLAAGWLAAREAVRPVFVPAPTPARGQFAERLLDRIDPNTAPWQDLATLPNIGEKRARDIVDYRQRFEKDHPGRPAFRRAEDLLPIKGLGVNLVAGMRPHLAFPPATSPPAAFPPAAPAEADAGRAATLAGHRPARRSASH